MANKVLTKFELNNTNTYNALHKIKLSGIKNGEASEVVSHATVNGDVDLSPIIPTVTVANAGKALMISSEGDRLSWSEAGKVDDVKTGTVSRVVNKVAELPSMSKGTGTDSIVLGSLNAANADSRASGELAVVEGYQTYASGQYAHAEGSGTNARGG